MSQSHLSDMRLQQLKEGNPAAEPEIQQFSFHEGNIITRKLCIAWHTGRKMVFHYAHFVTCDFDPILDCMILEFMTRTVTLKGYCLDILYESFLLDKPYTIAVNSERYAEMREPDQPFIIEAFVEK